MGTMEKWHGNKCTWYWMAKSSVWKNIIIPPSSKCVKIIIVCAECVYVLQVVRHVEINCKIDTLLIQGTHVM